MREGSVSACLSPSAFSISLGAGGFYLLAALLLPTGVGGGKGSLEKAQGLLQV